MFTSIKEYATGRITRIESAKNNGLIFFPTAIVFFLLGWFLCINVTADAKTQAIKELNTVAASKPAAR